jgi:hypothetical protein
MLGHRRPFRVPSPAAGRSRIPAHRNMLTCQRGGASEKTWCGLAVCASYTPRPTTLSGKHAVASVSNSGRNRRDGNHPGWSRLPAVSSWLSMRGVPLEARLTQIPLLQLTPHARQPRLIVHLWASCVLRFRRQGRAPHRRPRPGSTTGHCTMRPRNHHPRARLVTRP